MEEDTMDPNNPNEISNLGTQSGDSGTGFTTGTTGSMSGGTGTNATGGIGVTSASESTSSHADICPTCGQAKNRGGLDQFLGRLGINEEMIENLRTQFQNVDVDEYLNTAREYLKGSSGKATTYAKENPGKVAAGVAALALGAGLLFASTHRDKS
jgi:hypothetical protein